LLGRANILKHQGALVIPVGTLSISPECRPLHRARPPRTSCLLEFAQAPAGPLAARWKLHPAALNMAASRLQAGCGVHLQARSVRAAKSNDGGAAGRHCGTRESLPMVSLSDAGMPRSSWLKPGGKARRERAVRTGGVPPCVGLDSASSKGGPGGLLFTNAADLALGAADLLPEFALAGANKGQVRTNVGYFCGAPLRARVGQRRGRVARGARQGLRVDVYDHHVSPEQPRAIRIRIPFVRESLPWSRGRVSVAT